MRDLNICCWSIVSRQNRRKRVFGDGGAPMSVSGLNCVESCLKCHLRSRNFFCNLSQDSIEAFNKIKHAAVFPEHAVDRKSTRLNSSHSQISYAVFCLKTKK